MALTPLFYTVVSMTIQCVPVTPLDILFPPFHIIFQPPSDDGLPGGEKPGTISFSQAPCYNLDVAIDCISADGSAVGLTDLNFYYFFLGFVHTVVVFLWPGRGGGRDAG